MRRTVKALSLLLNQGKLGAVAGHCPELRRAEEWVPATIGPELAVFHLWGTQRPSLPPGQSHRPGLRVAGGSPNQVLAYGLD